MGFKNGDIVRFQHSFFPIDINVELMIFSDEMDDMFIRLIGVGKEEAEVISRLRGDLEISGSVFYSDEDFIVNERSKIGATGYKARAIPNNTYMWIFNVGRNITQDKLNAMFYNPCSKLYNNRFILKKEK